MRKENDSIQVKEVPANNWWKVCVMVNRSPQNCCPVWEHLWRSRARAVTVPGPQGSSPKLPWLTIGTPSLPALGLRFPCNHPRSDKSRHQLHQGPQAVSLRLCSSDRSPPQPSFRASLVVRWSGGHAGDTSSIPGRGRFHMLRSN